MSWLVHLNKFTNRDCVLSFHGMEDIVQFTELNIRPTEQRILSEHELTTLADSPHNSLYLNIDKYLIDLIGQELTFTEILERIKAKDPVAYKKICTALD